MNNEKLNLGCGFKNIPGYTGVDTVKTNATDIIHDLNNFPYPFADSSVIEIIMDNSLEHLDDIVKTMEEIYRMCKNGAIIKINVPYAKSDGAFKDPTHRHFFTERTFQYFTKEYKNNHYTKARFNVKKIKLINHSNTIGLKIRNKIPFRSFLKYFLLNMYDEIYFELECLK